ncbi:AAA family ATPase (plasmid) [Streptomyces sp. BI20]|uniref:AAA family ATPase n=1 Tax=Streptomyces sp. BI20 TaxID=3403460 RepID=UPI003C7354BC
MTDPDRPRPLLLVVSGGPGSGKTTLAHALAGALGCPAVVRDEIKQGLVADSGPGAAGDRENPDLVALRAFFDVLRTLLDAGVRVVAEAAYQDRLWRPGLVPLADRARIRVVRCVVPAAVARERIAARAARDPHRAAHADRALLAAVDSGAHDLDAFEPISLDVPTFTVDTSAGPADLAALLAFARAGGGPGGGPGGRAGLSSGLPDGPG